MHNPTTEGDNMEDTLIHDPVLDKTDTDMLNASDRCDSCGSQAFYWVNGVAGDLMFCRHHFLKNEQKIRAYAFEVVDETYKLNERPSASSA
jgi:ribosomal protein S14